MAHATLRGRTGPRPTYAEMAELARLRPLTTADLADEDGARIELIDGTLSVTPLADYEHQNLLTDLYDLLKPLMPTHLRMQFGVNVIEGDRTLVQPDLAVTDPKRVTERGLGVDPEGLLLAVEVTSPSTRRNDLTAKRDLYGGWAVPYVVLDRSMSPFGLVVAGSVPEWAQAAVEQWAAQAS